MVGHTINTHFNTVYSPHVQSFLFAINTPMIDIWIKTGSIYECGISNEDFKDDLVKMALVWRYEVGISRVLLERGHSIAAALCTSRVGLASLSLLMGIVHSEDISIRMKLSIVMSFWKMVYEC